MICYCQECYNKLAANEHIQEHLDRFATTKDSYICNTRKCLNPATYIYRDKDEIYELYIKTTCNNIIMFSTKEQKMETKLKETTVEEIKEKMAEEVHLDELMATAEALCQLVEENGPQYVSIVERIIAVFGPTLEKSLQDRAKSGMIARANGIIEASRILKAEGFSTDDIVSLLK